MDDSIPGRADDGGVGGDPRSPEVLSVSPATRVFVALDPVDMRKSFNGLYATVQSVLIADPLSGHLFVFTNRLKNRVKVIYWDGSGLWVCAKRLERGTFGWPIGEGASVMLRPEELQLLLHGLEAQPRRRWYRR
jgi:transposase